MHADNENIFDTVLVITDRIVVDRQLQEAILGIEHKSGQVKVMDALVEGYDQNVDFYTLLLSNEEVRAKFANVFMSEIHLWI